MAFSPDGAFVATSSRDRSACVWRLGAAVPQAVDLVGSPLFHVASIVRVRFLGDAQRLLTATDASQGVGGYAAIWRLSANEMIPSTDAFTDIVPGPEGIALDASAEQPAMVSVERPRSVVTGLPVDDPVESASDPLVSRSPAGFLRLHLPARFVSGELVAISRSGQHAVSASDGGTVRIYDVASARVVAEWKPLSGNQPVADPSPGGPSDRVTAVACHSGRQVAIVAVQSDTDLRIQLWTWGATAATTPADSQGAPGAVKIFEQSLNKLVGGLAVTRVGPVTFKRRR